MSHWYIIVATHGLIILFTLLLYNVPFCFFAFSLAQYTVYTFFGEKYMYRRAYARTHACLIII